ncbi:MAG TPA: protein kinase [Gemmatimonadaceae bacterium]|nr:protein kinase [Gemmatimonadaceae bacterium]
MPLTPERWERLQPYIDSALDLPAGQRAEYIEQVCAGDPELRGELERLLAECERGDSLIDRAATERFSLLLEDRRPMPRVLGDRYDVEREIGRGGMATVFRAQDRKHDRPVAIKVLRHEIAASVGPERFLREIRTAARLQHPHIMPLHDSGEADGLLYYVMPYSRGETLRERLEREKQFSLDEALRLSREVAGALDHAHGDGIVHRDIKPENIFLSGGHALVMDFGIARAVSANTGETAITFAGFAVGTPSYMSPEQGAAEQTIDGRADVYALGCVLYEMLTGHPPFMGASAQEIIARHSIDPVPSVRTSRPDIPLSVEHAISKALAKQPAARFPTASAFIDACREMQALPAPRETSRWLRTGSIAGIALVVVLGASSVLWPRKDAPRNSAASPAPSVAVLAFKNIDRDSQNDALSDGIAEEIATAIGKIPGLNVKAPRSSFSLRGKNLTIREIGSALNAEYLVDGSLQKNANRLRVRVALVAAKNDSTVWSTEYDRPVGDVFAIQDDIARSIAGELRVQLAPAIAVDISRRATKNTEAHEFYLRGRFFFEKRDSVSLRKAKEYFELAIARDPNYALAYAGLSDTYSHSATFGYTTPQTSMPMAIRYIDRALALDSTLAEAHASRGFITTFYDWDWRNARDEFAKAIDLDPRNPSAHLWRAWYYFATDSVDAAIREGREALAIEPFSLLLNTRLVSFLYYAHRYNEALAQAQKTLELDSTYFHINIERARVLAMLGRCNDAMNALARSPVALGPMHQAIRGFTYAKCGRRADVVAELQHLRNMRSRGELVSHYALAAVHAGLGDSDAAFAELELAYDEHAWCMSLLNYEPAFDNIRGDPRFAALARRVGLKT